MNIEFKHNSLSEKIAGLLPNLEVVTKTLKIQSVGKNNPARKLVISTNWLNIFNFNKGDDVVETVIGKNKGLTVALATSDDQKTKKVYSRSYKTRSDETQMDIRSNVKIDEGLGEAETAHIVFTKGLLTITPMFAAEHRAIDQGLDIKLGENGISFTAIIDALNVIREKGFKKVVIEADEEYKLLQEYTLFQMTIRRMGYTLEKADDGKLIATLGDGIVTGTSAYQPAPLKDFPDFVFNYNQPLSTFSVCTAGVDISGIEKEGFETLALLDFRPVEDRDVKKTKCPTTGEITRKLKVDKTETGAICAAINSKAAKIVFNENIYTFDLNRVAKHLQNHNFLQISLTCTDFSNLKNQKDKDRDILTLQSTRDMIFPAMELIEKTGIPTLLLENVPNFSDSTEAALFIARLEQIGYTVSKTVLNAGDFNGYTKRTRCFIFATKLGADFSWPTPVPRTVNTWNEIIEPNLHELRDVTHTKSVADALPSGRLRPFRAGHDTAPTIFKAQSRQCKDSLYAIIGDRYYMPSNSMLKMMMSISLDFDTSLFTREVTTEIIGQSCCLRLHKHLALAVKKHILSYADGTMKAVKAGGELVLSKASSLVSIGEQQELFA
jgi:site-specific DNA-cytosine methylase